AGAGEPFPSLLLLHAAAPIPSIATTPTSTNHCNLIPSPSSPRRETTSRQTWKSTATATAWTTRIASREYPGASELGGVGVRPEHLAQHVADLLLRAVRLRRVDDRRHQVAAGRTGRLPRRTPHRVERRADARRVASRLHLREVRDLGLLYVLVDPEEGDVGRPAALVLVDADHHALALLEGPLEAVGARRDLALRVPLLDRR